MTARLREIAPAEVGLIVSVSCTGIMIPAVIVGSAVAMLLAPKAGSELRNDLKDRLRSAQDTLPEQLRGATGGATSATDACISSGRSPTE